MASENNEGTTPKAPYYVDAFVGQKIRTRRVSLGLTQQDLATALGITFQQVQKYENGKNRVSASTLFRLSFALGVGVSHFFDGLPEEPDENVPVPSSLPTNLEPSQKRELLEFIRAFSRIHQPRMRGLIVDMVKELAEDPKMSDISGEQ